MSILRLSDSNKPSIENGVALVMVGSFAPVHEGHFDAIVSAKKALEDLDERVSVVVMSPNSDSYVLKKVGDETGEWNLARRISEFALIDHRLTVPVFVDDFSGLKTPEKTITEAAIENVKKELGIEACRIVLTVGSDQAHSMKPYLDNNRAVCVLRPGSSDSMDILNGESWFNDAIKNGRYIITNRENTEVDINSTSIRKRLTMISQELI